MTMFYVVAGVIIVVALIALFIISEMKWELRKGAKYGMTFEVIDTNYIPAESSTSMSPGITSGGQLAISSSTHSTPERHMVVLRSLEGDQIIIDSKALYDQSRIGDKRLVTLQDQWKQHVETGDIKNHQTPVVEVEGVKFSDLNIMKQNVKILKE